MQLWSNFNLRAASLLCTPSRNLNSFLRQLLAEINRRERELEDKLGMGNYVEVPLLIIF